MKQLLTDIKQLWCEQTGFKIASTYLLFLLAMILVLPVLPLPYNPNELDLQHIFQKPFNWSSYATTEHKHWFGTDALGRDVLANVLYGARSAFMVSFPVMLLSTGIGVIIGVSSGFFGNKGMRISRAGLAIACIAALLIFYFGIYLPLNLYQFGFTMAYIGVSIVLLFVLLLVLFNLLLPLLRRWSSLGHAMAFPVDYIALRLIEALNTVPNLLLILVIASFLPPSILLLSIVIVATSWTSTARLARAEMLKISHLTYFEAARSLGLSQKKLLIGHALPNMLGPIIITFSFGLAGLLALESTLSFLGIGVPSTFVSWGRTIAGIRSNTSAWWLVVFPGSALALTVLALQTVSYHLLNAIQQKKHP